MKSEITHNINKKSPRKVSEIINIKHHPDTPAETRALVIFENMLKNNEWMFNKLSWDYDNDKKPFLEIELERLK